MTNKQFSEFVFLQMEEENQPLTPKGIIDYVYDHRSTLGDDTANQLILQTLRNSTVQSQIAFHQAQIANLQDT